MVVLITKMSMDTLIICKLETYFRVVEDEHEPTELIDIDEEA